MFRSRLLIALGVCFLAASGAWADDFGYVDCSSHSEGTQVFAKPRKTPDIVAPLACGERFTILVYGFYFSRIQTKDGQVGYIYSNLIVVDNGAPRTQQVAPQTPAAPAAKPAVEQAPSFQTASEITKIPRTPPIDAEAATAAPASPATTQPEAVGAQPAAVQPEATPTAATAQSVTAPTDSAASSAPAVASVSETPTASGATGTTESSPTSAAPAPTLAPTAPIQPPSDAAPANAAQPSSGAAAAADAASVSTKQPDSSAATESASPAPSQPDAAAAQPSANAPASPAATSAQPEPSAAQPEPVPAQPAPAPAIRPGDRTETWEKPNPSARTAPLVELFGGYAFTRVGGASNGTNLNGALGSFGWNPTSWLQVVADTSYSVQTIGNTKNTLYGNHFGPRFFRRTRFRWGITPFAEALVGGSSEKTTISGSGGSTSNTGSAISYKVGGGIDIHPSRHWDVRLFDFDYYRTSFGSGAQQNNYWISSGIVLRLFGGRDE